MIFPKDNFNHDHQNLTALLHNSYAKFQDESVDKSWLFELIQLCLSMI